MSVSAIFGTSVALPPLSVRAQRTNSGGCGRVTVIECSSRPQKKATAHHKKTRPRKTQAWDIKRGPAVYAPLPPLPPEWTIVTPASEAQAEITTPALAAATEQVE
ncbi:hypothetical protein vseg_012515 [Gypsophila vaccaria]